MKVAGVALVKENLLGIDTQASLRCISSGSVISHSTRYHIPRRHTITTRISHTLTSCQRMRYARSDRVFNMRRLQRMGVCQELLRQCVIEI